MNLSESFWVVVNHEWLWYALPLFGFMLISEYLLFLRQHPEYFSWQDSGVSLGAGAVALGLIFITKTLWLGVFYGLYTHRMFDLGHAPWVWALLFLADDFTYYWFHRLGHQVNILWAGHSTHHSARHYHYATALRQAWLEYFYKYAYWMWLPLVGFDPLMVFSMLTLSQIYGFLLHTEAVGKLGALEEVLSTPSHHRVHHGMQPEYIDRNFGGFLIVWDRLFGTYAVEQQRPRYGITHDPVDDRVLSVGLRGYAKVARQFAKAENARARWAAVFGSP
jgi:sterol desaturase/sphingolipid hydroxylase (fatty acid hydroxylase superfamily)